MITDRDPILDNIKAFGMILVVIGHAPAIPPFLVSLVYSFHMPLFFFLSGYQLSKNRLLLESWNAWFLRSGRTLLLPWLIFYLLSWAYQLAAALARGDTLKGLTDTTPIWGFITGTSESMTVNMVLWFFPALLLTGATFRCLYRTVGAKYTLIATVILASIWMHRNPMDEKRWLWSADCVPVALCFYSLGNTISKYGDWIVDFFKRHAHSIWGVSWFLGLVFLVELNGRVDLNGLNWGKSPLLYISTALWGIGGLWWVATQTRQFRYVNWIAQNNLIIFPLHPLLFGGITGFGMMILNLPNDFQYGHPAIGIAYVTMTLLLAVLAIRVD